MKIFENQTFERFRDRDSGKTFSDIEFINCRFSACVISLASKPALRSIVRNVRLKNCEVQNCLLDNAVLDDITVDGLKTGGLGGGLFQTWGTVFKHVILKGKIRRVMFSQVINPGNATKEQQQTFDEANAIYYSSVDWALDISQGEFEECEIQGVPATLIRRDSETQMLVTRAKAACGEWRNLDLSRTHWATSLEFFLKRGDEDVVLVAPKRSKKFHELLGGLKMLRDAGVAEPN